MMHSEVDSKRESLTVRRPAAGPVQVAFPEVKTRPDWTFRVEPGRGAQRTTTSTKTTVFFFPRSRRRRPSVSSLVCLQQGSKDVAARSYLVASCSSRDTLGT